MEKERTKISAKKNLRPQLAVKTALARSSPPFDGVVESTRTRTTPAGAGRQLPSDVLGSPRLTMNGHRVLDDPDQDFFLTRSILVFGWAFEGQGASGSSLQLVDRPMEHLVDFHID